MIKLYKLFFIFTALYFQSNTALAYFDPGVGSLILQYLAMGLAFVATGLTFFWEKIKRVYFKMKKKIKLFFKEKR